MAIVVCSPRWRDSSSSCLINIYQLIFLFIISSSTQIRCVSSKMGGEGEWKRARFDLNEVPGSDLEFQLKRPRFDLNEVPGYDCEFKLPSVSKLTPGKHILRGSSSKLCNDLEEFVRSSNARMRALFDNDVNLSVRRFAHGFDFGHVPVVDSGEALKLKIVCLLMSLQAKIHRCWDVNPRGKVMSINMVLIDKKGDKIQGLIIDQDAMKKHRKYIEEGSVIQLSRFYVGPVTGQCRPTKHPYRININFGTRIEPCGENIASEDFDFVSFEEIGLDEKPEDYLIDIIGVVKEHGSLEPYQYQGEVAHKLMLILANESAIDQVPTQGLSSSQFTNSSQSTIGIALTNPDFRKTLIDIKTIEEDNPNVDVINNVPGANSDAHNEGRRVTTDASSDASGAEKDSASSSTVPETILDSGQDDDWTPVRTRRKAQQKEVQKGEVSKPPLKNG
ncbi:hypothetical protein RIF29_14598 [Crotalaria pallida]|uniref:Replication protein A 70 kDa DNA-binding subunit B/D first OB fold domain-containing protein n=1 Tax=Crotalaria pallida TaxID=3830 RepID=A0AAN9FBX6_CROPI